MAVIQHQRLAAAARGGRRNPPRDSAGPPWCGSPARARPGPAAGNLARRARRRLRSPAAAATRRRPEERRGGPWAEPARLRRAFNRLDGELVVGVDADPADPHRLARSFGIFLIVVWRWRRRARNCRPSRSTRPRRRWSTSPLPVRIGVLSATIIIASRLCRYLSVRQSLASSTAARISWLLCCVRACAEPLGTK